MSEPVDHPDLIALLRGELATDVVLAAETHVAECADCRAELSGLVTAHALLTRAARTQDHPAAPATASTPAAQLPPRRPVRSRTPAVVAAVACLVAGSAIGGVAGALWGRDGESDAPSPYAAAALAPLTSGGHATGRVEMVADGDDHTRMRLRTADLPALRGGRFYYAWLLDPATNKMLPLGQVRRDGTATFELDDALLDAYSAVDVSLEADDGDPAHSATSVLRGRYGAASRS